ncbi:MULTISPECIES: thiamine diphosphokinase [Leuconostoc]|uniref:Thiamine diphosphokinase n=1 Tax=Leuconostoc pseudomesenteroides TaxID=33968 RepID=A0A5B8T6L1_LEUPS|nr:MULTISPECIES: thiamine diphosphokinase [Leuconostoc]MCC8440316.1 thiamine diphosphokinase [Leuconostoc pseudomesenteroides]MDG9733266.1 thiamine diphosphokinase [Leuconostoc pseudomesenteroides]MDN2451632.1 thiamine diphosphokinase [Leuconostoc sp. UCMA20149]NKZ36585.1 thiamine diphosphokinase [Leuconostoc pseudomesenteroides]QEA42808.1 thiamine diphosphokinase [Leuconostoc pseudomesenteroides]
MQINILAGGPVDLWPKNLFNEPGVWIGADRGAWYLYQHRVAMMLAVGDFDSLTSAEFEALQEHITAENIVHVRAEKDETDTELAIMFAQKQSVSCIKVFGATGGRLDHLLSNLWLMADPKFDDVVEKLEIIDQTNSVTFFKAGQHSVLKHKNSHYLGFMPINDVKNFKIIDAKYPLTLTENKYKMWSSNEFLNDRVHVSFDTGIIMVTQSIDRS